MEVRYSDDAIEDIAYWKRSGNKAVQKKITQLVLETLEHPFTGLGKPEQLKYEYAGYWSRRITIEHRMVYEVVGDELHIMSLRGHYTL